MIQNYIIVRDGETFEAKGSLPFINFSCSYGWEHRGGNNSFSVKTNYTGTLIPLGDFIQLGMSNWCGQILNIDVNFKEKTVLYTGDSLYNVVNHFIPVRTTETIDCYSITSIDTHGEGRADSEDRINAILTAYANKWGNSGVVKRANELLTLAHFPLVLGSRNTTVGNITNPNESGWTKKYTSYKFYTLGEMVSIFYGSNNQIYFNENPPSGVSTLLTLRVATDDVEFNSKTPLLKSFEDKLDVHSYTSVLIGQDFLTHKDYISFVIGNRFYVEDEDTIFLDKFQSPIYYHEKMSENMAAFPEWSLEQGEAIIGNTSGVVSETSYAPNDIDYNNLDYANSYAKGGKLYFYSPQANDAFEGKYEYYDYLKDQRLTYDHTLEIYDDEKSQEFEVGKTYRLFSLETGIDVKADMFEKSMDATPNGTKITYKFRENISEAEED